MSKPRLSQTTPMTGVILAGGQSRRMGRPKEGVRLPDGRLMLDAVLSALSPLCLRIIIVGDCRGYDWRQRPELLHLPDVQPGQGPLAALETLLASGLAKRYLVAACDQPGLKPRLLQRLIEATDAGDHLVFFRSAETRKALDPFPGLYPSTMLPAVQAALQIGERALRPALRQQPTHWVDLPAHEQACLESINTPEALAAFCQTTPQPEVLA